MKKKLMPEKVADYAKKILPKCKNRTEVRNKVAKHFKLGSATVETYFSLTGFKTGFKAGRFLEEYWAKIRSGEKQEPKWVFPHATLRFLSQIFKEPAFTWEFKNLSISNCYHVARGAGLPVRNFIIPALSKTQHRLKKPSDRTQYPVNPRMSIYFFEHQKKEAYQKVLEHYKNYGIDRNINSVRRAFGLKINPRIPAGKEDEVEKLEEE